MTASPPIEDSFGRRFPYVRLSITDVCNFKCSYCLPDGYKKTDCPPFLSQAEILRFAKAFAALGVWKIRLTGGEPTVRKDFIEIAEQISALAGIKKLAFTTNGYKLAHRAQSYFDAGLRAINISVDSLNSDQFKAITGHDRLQETLKGVEASFKAGFKQVKLNTVLLKGLNDSELNSFLDFVKDHPLSLRFIELMRTGDNQDYFANHHLSSQRVRDKLLAHNWQLQPREEGAGPAQEFAHKQSQGTIGLIAPYSKDFCKSCNRLRASATGALHLCLFGEGGYSLRHLLQSDEQQQTLKEKITELMQLKKSSHFLQENNSGAIDHLASIGG